MAEGPAKIVSLRNTPIPEPGQPVPEVIARLEELLQLARDGEIHGIAIAIAFPGNVTSWSITGSRPRSLLGTLELLKFDICKDHFAEVGE
jgi:hypothetical protein